MQRGGCVGIKLSRDGSPCLLASHGALLVHTLASVAGWERQLHCAFGVAPVCMPGLAVFSRPGRALGGAPRELAPKLWPIPAHRRLEHCCCTKRPAPACIQMGAWIHGAVRRALRCPPQAPPGPTGCCLNTSRRSGSSWRSQRRGASGYPRARCGRPPRSRRGSTVRAPPRTRRPEGPAYLPEAKRQHASCKRLGGTACGWVCWGDWAL